MLLNKTIKPSKILEETINYVKNGLNDIIYDITIERAVIGIFFLE